MADAIDEATIIAWIDGELDPVQAEDIERRLTDNAELAALAERHRRMKARFAAAFEPLADVSAPSRPTATVVSLAGVRAERRERAARTPRRWVLPGAIAASLMVGLLAGHGVRPAPGIGDRADALALAPALNNALDRQLSGTGGAVRIALTFRNHDGRFCRSFDAEHFAGIACREDGSWHLRYGGPAQASDSDYRQAGSDQQRMAAVNSIIAGEPLDRQREETARAGGWR